MSEKTFWNGNSEMQPVVYALEKLIPLEGSVANPRKNKALEKFRKASNCYYDLFNNGLCNRAREFASVFGIDASYYRHPVRRYDFTQELYERAEKRMQEIVLAAAAEQITRLANI